ncbi:MAG: CHC2 zinc finger domain-containing protein [Bacteroidales bacterium]|jgi:hypothetical protein
MTDLDVINAQIDLVAWVEAAGSKLRNVGRSLSGRCPLHGGDNPNGFSVYDNGRLWNCFSGDCGGGDALRFIMKFKKVTLPEAINIATGGATITKEEILRIQQEQAERAARELEKSIARAQEMLKELRSTQIWLQYHEQLENSDVGRQWWENRGIGSDFQKFWKLGYVPDRRIWVGEEVHYPTATIPIFGKDWSAQNVKHRIIGAPKEVGKYRYEYPDLTPLFRAPIFISDPDLDTPNALVLVEGEIKAMVTFLTLDTPNWQVIGIPSKNTPVDNIKELTKDVDVIYICCDPDTGSMNEEVAKELGVGRCRIVETPMKIDDLILTVGMDKNTLRNYFSQSRKIKENMK